MKDANFIPKHRAHARRRRRRRNLWVTAVAAYVALLLGAYASCYALWGGGGDALAAKQQAAEARTRNTKQAIAATQSELASEQRTLNANREVRNHPDWSLLLMLLAESMNDDVVLSQCDLKPGDPPNGRSPQAHEANGFRLDMSGYAKTVASVSRFALELERTGLFDHVRLLKTKRQPFRSASATCFQIECLLGRHTEGAE
ncbi:MAG TPA: PilN domain-containing protein [Phycisphaerae bacterium]|nr:PilN domain-containing protein [Phycisphaerae bacterium]